jgi:RHS repeat-associated protein
VNGTTGAVYMGDSASGATDMRIDTWQGSALALSATSTLDGIATAIATPTPAFIHYDVFAVNGSEIDVVDSATGDTVQTIEDSNEPINVVPSPDGREIYVINLESDNGASLTPSVQIITTADIGTAGSVISTYYDIPETQSTPYSYSLSNTPVPVSAALSPSGDTLLVTDSANSVVFSIEVGPSSLDTELGKVIGVAHLDGSTAVTPEAITVTPSGSSAFVADAAGVTDLAYSSSTGAYGSPNYQAGSSLSDSDSHELETPTQIVASNDGRSVYVLDATSGRPLLFQFPVTTSGTLTNESTTAIPAGTDPVGLSLSPEDSVAYLSDHATDELYAIDISDGSGTEVWGSPADVTPGLNINTPDGQYIAVAEQLKTVGCEVEGVDGFSIFEADNGTDDADISLVGEPTALAVSPVSSSVQDVSTLAFQGQINWPEMIGGSNPDESAVSGLEDVQAGGTPSDAPGVSAGTNTDLRSYELSLDAMTLPSVGPSLDVSASYDSQLIAGGVDTGSTPAAFAQGWRLSTGVTATQISHSASIDPCQIDVTQENGSEVYFEPVANAPYSSCPTSDYEAPPWAQAKVSFASDCTGTDSCWVVTNEISGVATYIDSTSSPHLLVKEVDRNSNALTFSYTSGVLTSMTESSRAIDFSYPTAGTSPCPSSFNSQTVAKCMVATDPIGRTATFILANAPTAGYDLIGETLAESGDTSASYAFDYSGNLMTSWWDPQNFATYGTTSEATDVSYAGDGLDWVTQVTGPEVTDQGTDMTDTYTPTYTYTYPCQDLYVGSGTVIVTDANANWNAANPDDAVSGANITLDGYVDFGLATQIQGYGPAENDNADAVTSETATTLRDPLTLLPDETINPLADTGTGTLFNAGTTFYTYDAFGNVLATTTPGPTDGTWATTTSQYNMDNEPVSGKDADGNATTSTYTSGGEVATTTSPPSNEWTSAPETSNYYDSNGTICASRTADEVASYGVLTSCSTSHDSYYTYDSEGDLLTTVDPMGDVNTSAYDSDGDECATLTPDGYAASYTLTSCPSAAEPYETVNLTRNVFNDVTSSVSPSNAPGGTTWTYYNLNGDETVTVSVLGDPGSCNPLTTFTCLYTSYQSYDPDGDEISTVTATVTSGDTGPTTTTFFDPDGNTVATVPPAGNLSDSPANFEQVSVNDSLGDEVSSTPVASLSAECSVSSISSLCPNTTFSTYDANGDQTASYSPNSSGSATIANTTTFDPAGNDESDVSSTGSGSMSTTTSTYDLNGNQLESTDVGHSGSGSVTTGTITTYEPDGATCWSSTLAWTGESSPTCTDPPLSSGNETTMDYYDATGNLVAVTGPGGNPYAPSNTSGCNPLTTSECGFTTYYTFNEGGEQVTTTLPEDANSDYPLTTSYFDASGSPIAVQGPAGSPGSCDPVTTFTCTDTTYKTFDADGRVDTIDYTDGTSDVTYTYNDDGTRATMEDGTGTTTYTYSPIGQTVASTNGADATDTWAFNEAGQMTCESYPNGSSDTCSTSGAGTTSPPNGDLSFFYDEDGRLSSEATWTGVTLTYGYDCAGDVAWVSTGTASTTECNTTTDSDPSAPTGSAVTTSYGYDSSSGLQTSQATTANGGSTNLLSFSFGYDQQGRLTSSTPIVDGTALTTDDYGYDTDNRVSSGPIVGDSGSTTYGYTTADGITADTNTFATAGYSPSGELCWSSTTAGSSACSSTPSPRTAYSYNADGERTAVTPTSGDHESLGWNISSQQLICINTDGTTCSTSEPTASTTLYSYNGDGLRATALNQDVTNSFTWSPQGDQLLADSTHDYVYGFDQTTPIMQIETADYSTTPSIDLIVDDTNDNTRGVVQLQGDTSGNNNTLVNYTDYDAFGNPITEAGGSLNTGGLNGTDGVSYDSLTFGFGDSYNDASGLNYLVNRYYDAASGQFVNIDPDLSTTLQPYDYANDDPIGKLDSDGLYTYTFNWNLDIYGSLKRDTVFAFFAAYASATFPFPESCKSVTKVGQKCVLDPQPPGGTTDRLHISELQKSNGIVTPNLRGADYFQFEVDSWTTNIGHVTVDPPGSKITFYIYLDSSGSIHLVQHAHAKSTRLNSIPGVVSIAKWDWFQQSLNLLALLEYVYPSWLASRSD